MLAVPPLTGRNSELEVDKFGSTRGFRNYNLSVNTPIPQAGDAIPEPKIGCSEYLGCRTDADDIAYRESIDPSQPLTVGGPRRRRGILKSVNGSSASPHALPMERYCWNLR
jgi:hypothetical protein